MVECQGADEDGEQEGWEEGGVGQGADEKGLELLSALEEREREKEGCVMSLERRGRCVRRISEIPRDAQRSGGGRDSWRRRELLWSL